MSQDTYNKNDKKPRLPKFNKPGADGENNTPRKGPKFSFYWVYAVIFAILLGFQFFGSGFTPAATTISYTDFEGMLRRGDVQEYTVISNRNLVRVLVKKANVSDSTGKLVKNYASAEEPQAAFKIGSVESFKDDLRDFYRRYPDVGRVNEKADAENNWLPSILQSILPFLLLIGIWILLMRKMSGGAGTGGGPGGIFNIGKSKATLFDKGTKVNITFADVAGLDEAKVEVMEIVDFLRNPKKYTALGGKIPKGALLVGPPGTGKTLLAKAMAGEAQVPFFSLSGSDFVEMFVGVGASRVRDLFKQAREKAPCVIFIDEIDAMAVAMRVICCKSFCAPVEILPKKISSAARPPSVIQIWSCNWSVLYRYCSFGVYCA